MVKLTPSKCKKCGKADVYLYNCKQHELLYCYSCCNKHNCPYCEDAEIIKRENFDHARNI